MGLVTLLLLVFTLVGVQHLGLTLGGPFLWLAFLVWGIIWGIIIIDDIFM